MKLVPKVTLKEMLTNGSLRKPLIIAMMMMLAQQLSGINCAMFYSTSIFKSAGLDAQASQSATLGMGTMNVLMTFVSLVLIEKAGRKTLMVIGLAVMFLMTTLLLAALLTYVSFNTNSKLKIFKCVSLGICCCNVIRGHCCRHHVRCWICHWSRIHSLVLRDRTVRPVRKTHSNIHRRHCQLVCKLSRWTWLCSSPGSIGSLCLHYLHDYPTLLHSLCLLCRT